MGAAGAAFFSREEDGAGSYVFAVEVFDELSSARTMLRDATALTSQTGDRPA